MKYKKENIKISRKFVTEIAALSIDFKLLWNDIVRFIRITFLYFKFILTSSESVVQFFNTKAKFNSVSYCQRTHYFMSLILITDR